MAKQSVLAFILTANEDKLFRNLFPPEFDISQTTVDDLLQMPKVPKRLKNRTFLIEAIKFSEKEQIVSPQTFKRVKDEADKGTADSSNWPSLDYRKTIPVDPEDKQRLINLATKHFSGSITDAIVWCLRNFNAALYHEPHVVEKRKERVRVEVKTKAITTRVTEEVFDLLTLKAASENVTVSKMVGMLITQTMGTMKIKPNPWNDEMVVIESEEFDFDLEEDVEDDPER